MRQQHCHGLKRLQPESWSVVMESEKGESNEKYFIFRESENTQPGVDVLSWCTDCSIAWCKMEPLRPGPWVYNRIWIQSLSRASVHSYESCSVAHEAKNDRLPGSKNTWIRRSSSASATHSARTLLTPLLRLCVIWVEPANSNSAS